MFPTWRGSKMFNQRWKVFGILLSFYSKQLCSSQILNLFKGSILKDRKRRPQSHSASIWGQATWNWWYSTAVETQNCQTVLCICKFHIVLPITSMLILNPSFPCLKSEFSIKQFCGSVYTAIQEAWQGLVPLGEENVCICHYLVIDSTNSSVFYFSLS